MFQNRPNHAVNSQYGAPMGRRDYQGDPDTCSKFYLQRVALDSGGYDRGGAYWGLGCPLYYFEECEGDASGFLRAPTRQEAKAQVLESYPGARFFR